VLVALLQAHLPACLNYIRGYYFRLIGEFVGDLTGFTEAIG
jgi:hypothetical protein